MSNPKRVLIIALLLIFIGGLTAWFTQTDGGDITIKDVRWVGSNGTLMSALLYIPDGVSAENPAPGIVAIHGYINSRETQDGFAIEFARRGYVVLASDQTGHGYSDPPAFANGFGGPDSLAYLRTLDIVDKDNIGLEGHSMGGWAVAVAAGVYPDDYKAIVLAGSSTGTFGAPEGTPEWPRNFGLVFSEWDEFSALMWLSPVPKDIVNTDKLKAAFGTSEDVVVGKLYGSIEDGTARMLFQPRTTHPGDHLSREAIGDAVQWFQMTLDGGNGLDPSNQIWYWKEIGNLIALIGMMMLLLPVGMLLLKTEYFSELAQAPAPAKPSSSIGWWFAALVTMFLGPLTLFTFKEIPTTQEWSATALFPQEITNGVVTWTTLLGLITIVIFLVWHFAFNKKAGGTAEDYGLTWNGKLDWRKIGKSLLFAFLIAFAGYFTLLLTDYFFKTDFRFWVFAVKLLNPLQLRIALSYLIPFLFYFLMLNLVVFGQLRKAGWGLWKQMLVNVVILVLGYVVVLVYQYVPLLSGGTLALADESLWSIIMFQFLPLMTIAGVLMTFFNRKTGRVYVGAFLFSMLLSWIVVASTAIHYAF
ncbi:MAG: alpha/beta fold hydrolase [Anaerolineales bacterium]